MPALTSDISFMRQLDPTGRLETWARTLMQSHNHVAAQANVAPVGQVAAPPPISNLNVTAADGIHKAVITDNSPVQQGIIYHFEKSASPDFPTGQTYLVQSGPSRTLDHLHGEGEIHWRAYSQYPASAPSTPVYFGTQQAPTPVNAGGTIVGPIAPTSTASGTDQGQLPQGGKGFGPGPEVGGTITDLNPGLSPRLPL